MRPVIVSGTISGIADTKFAALFEIAFRFNRSEKLLRVIDQFGCEPYALRIARHCEQALPCSSIVEPLDRRS